jgi:hypothetical protein
MPSRLCRCYSFALAREASDAVPDEVSQQAERDLLGLAQDVLLTAEWKTGDLSWCQSSIVPRRASDDDDEEGIVDNTGSDHVAASKEQIGWRLLATCFIDAGATGGPEDAALEERLREALRPVLDAEGEARPLEVEAWVTCPCRLPLVEVDAETLDASLRLGNGGIDAFDIKRACATLREEGVCVISTAIPRAQAEELRVTTKSLIQCADAALDAKGIDVGTQSFTFADISSRGNFRFDLKFDTGCDDSSASCEAVRTLLETGPWVPLVLEMLGATVDEVVRRADLIYSRPGSPHQEWHSDGPHYGPGADEMGQGHAPSYAVCVFVPLIDLTQATGYTAFWPGSHKYPDLLGFGPCAPLLHSDWHGMLNAGDAVLYDYRCVHRGMANVSSDTERPLIQFLYHLHKHTEAKNFFGESLLPQ